MDKTERDVHHVLYKVVGQVSLCLSIPDAVVEGLLCL